MFMYFFVIYIFLMSTCELGLYNVLPGGKQPFAEWRFSVQIKVNNNKNL